MGPKKEKNAGIKNFAKGVGKGLLNAATAKQRLAVGAASGVLKLTGVDNKLTKNMDKIAKGFKEGGKVKEEMPKAKPN